jgi:hypothetical protein
MIRLLLERQLVQGFGKRAVIEAVGHAHRPRVCVARPEALGACALVRHRCLSESLCSLLSAFLSSSSVTYPSLASNNFGIAPITPQLSARSQRPQRPASLAHSKRLVELVLDALCALCQV